MHRTLITIALSAALAACVADNGDEGIIVTKNVTPATGCAFVSDPTEAFISHGELSVISPIGYRIHPQMKSRITATDPQVDQRTIIMQGARIDVAFSDANLFNASELANLKSTGVTHFEAAFSAPLKPNGGVTDAGFDLFQKDLIDAVAAKVPGLRSGNPTFRTELLATFTVFGELAGSEVTSQEFRYPVTLCNDCVVHNLGACDMVPTSTTARTGDPCNPFQDGVLDCCTTSAGLVCPAVGTMP